MAVMYLELMFVGSVGLLAAMFLFMWLAERKGRK